MVVTTGQVRQEIEMKMAIIFFPNMRGTTDNQICSINDFWSPVKVQNIIGSPEASSARYCLA